jgi:hypothetical protein
VSTIEQTRMRGANDEHPSARWNELIGPQGETLIIELRTAKRAIDRVRHSGWRERVVSGRGQGVGPEQTLRFSRPSESLDRFDDRSLQNPIDSAGDRVLLKNDSPIEVGTAFHNPSFAADVKAQIRWLFTGAATETDVTGDFAAQVVRRHEIELKTALRVLIASIVVVGIWATMVPISGAVVVPGTLVVESRVKKIQHPTGGVLAEIDVEDGTHVNAGTLLARLDQTQLQANQQIIADQLDQTRARIARLISERDGLSDIQTPQQLDLPDEPATQASCA